jgi:hypothetical protein
VVANISLSTFAGAKKAKSIPYDQSNDTEPIKENELTTDVSS